MNICKPHWDELKAAITTRGLGDFIAKDGHELMRQMEKSLTDPDVLHLEDFDPLMAANNMIVSQALETAGLGLMAPDEAGNPRCPLCLCAGPYASNWINGASDQAAEMVAELRKGPVNIKAKREEHDRRGGSA